MIWMCSSRSPEPIPTDSTENGWMKLPEMARKVALINGFPAQKWLWLFNSSTFSYYEPPLRFSRTSILYRLEVGNKLPTSPQDLASKRAPDPPIMAKIPQNWLK
jgi:hypothetical protein